MIIIGSTWPWVPWGWVPHPYLSFISAYQDTETLTDCFWVVIKQTSRLKGSRGSSGCQWSQSPWSFPREDWIFSETSLSKGLYMCSIWTIWLSNWQGHETRQDYPGTLTLLWNPAPLLSESSQCLRSVLFNPHFSGDNSFSLWNQMNQSRLELFREARR